MGRLILDQGRVVPREGLGRDVFQAAAFGQELIEQRPQRVIAVWSRQKVILLWGRRGQAVGP